MKSAEAMTELVKKYEDQEQFPRMIGSEGGMDYLIVAKDEKAGLQLGIKALFGQGVRDDKQAILCGFRLRSARIPDAKSVASVSSIAGETQAEGYEPKNPHEGWDFPWERVGSTSTGDRASLIRTIALSRTPDEAGWVFDDLDHVRFFGKVQKFLHDRVPEEQFVVTDDDIADYLRASYYGPVLTMQAMGGDPKKQLELLEHTWETKVKNHEAHQAQYEERKAALLAKIAEMESGEPAAYQPKAHFGEDDLIPMESVAQAMLEGAKPKLSVVSSDDSEGNGGESYEESAGGFGSVDEEPDMSSEAQHDDTVSVGHLQDSEGLASEEPNVDEGPAAA
jgi:hypothetical protein